MSARAAKGGRSPYRRTVFENGLTLVSERAPEFKSLSIGFWVKVGTRHERASEAGMSHFLEHMLFKGTETRSALDIAREMDRAGGDFNAFTGREYTCFHVLLLARDFKLALDILGDVMLNSDFDAEELERERKVILQEVSMVEESPEEVAYDIFYELVYGRHGLGRPVLGSESSVRRLRRSDVLRFFRRYYRPDQLIIAVSGDVSHEALRRKLKPLTRRSWPGRPKPSGRAARRAERPRDESATRLKAGRWWIRRDTEQVHLLWGIETPPHGSRDRYAASLFNAHLGGGMSSVLFQEIREKHGLAYTVYSSLSPYKDSGVFTVYAATTMGQVPLCLKLVEDCVGALGRALLTASELRTAQENLKSAILLSADSVEARMSGMAGSEIFREEHLSIEEACRRIDEVTSADVRRFARKVLRDGRRSILALGPKPSPKVAAALKPVFPKKFNPRGRKR